MSSDKPRRSIRLPRIIGSFGLACVLLLLLFALTLLGTFEQADHALYEVQKKYFESWFLVTDSTVFGVGPIRIPLPGGMLVMGVLAVNLVVGGVIRLRKSVRTAGILVAHLGVLLMLAAGLVKFALSNDGALKLYEGTSSREYVSYYRWEVAIWELPASGNVLEHIIPEKDFRDLAGAKSATFRSSDLPFTLTLSNYLQNCRPLPKGPNWQAASPVVDGYAFLERDPEKEAEWDLAGLHAVVRSRGSEQEQAGLLWGFDLLYPFAQENDSQMLPWTVEADGRTFAISLRHERYPMPFTVHLDDFRAEFHPRTNTAKSYESDITVIEGDDVRPVLIQMNEPLRYKGLVLFQSGWGPQTNPQPARMFSIFSVVRNPSDHWPLYSCLVIAAGLLFAFSTKLVRHIRSQSTARARVVAEA
jgi:hypothetical protein